MAEAKLICQYCGKEYKTLKSYAKHIKTFHAEEDKLDKQLESINNEVDEAIEILETDHSILDNQLIALYKNRNPKIVNIKSTSFNLLVKGAKEYLGTDPSTKCRRAMIGTYVKLYQIIKEKFPEEIN